MMTLTDTATFRIRAAYLESLREALAGVAAKARKLGVSEPVLTVLGYVTRPRGQEGAVEFVDLQVESEVPRFDGWSFQGSVEPVDGQLAAAVLRLRPGHELSGADVDALKARDGRCDHCRTLRDRASVFVVRHEQGAVQVVGRSCLKDFTGHKDALAVARFFETLDSLLISYQGDFDPDTRGIKAVPIFSPLDLLAAAACVVRQRGQYTAKDRVSADPDGERFATADAAQKLLSSCLLDSGALYGVTTDRRGRHVPPYLTGGITDADHERAAEALAWVRALPEGERAGEYLHNLHTILSGELVTVRHAALAASAVAAYARASAQAQAARRREETAALKGEGSQHLGTVGERLRGVKFTVERRLTLGDHFAPYFIYLLRDPAGNALKIGTGTRLHYQAQGRHTDLGEGDTGELTGTVKAHETYKEERQTVVQRVKLGAVTPAAGQSAAPA